MKTLYLECAMGASGDMLTAALLELLEDPAPFYAAMESLAPLGVTFRSEKSENGGVSGTKAHVYISGEEEGHPHDHDHGHDHEHEHDHAHKHEHAHSALGSIEAQIDALTALPPRVREDTKAVYRRIAQAEAAVHGQPVELVHFHEVGALDAVCDVTAVCLLVELLGRPEIVASPIHVGSGTVRCAHGILPVPAPATARLLTGLPCYGGEVAGELCTPTGAALLAHFATSFGPLPPLRIERIGTGLGSKHFDGRSNCLRAFLGTRNAAENGDDEIVELCCNLDDMSGEALAFASERLFALGARDVLLIPATGKKGRPAVLLQCLCAPAEEAQLVEALFRHTTTLGVRKNRLTRATLARRIEQVDGVRVKCAEGYGVRRAKVEFEDAARLAREQGRPLAEVSAEILKKWEGE